MSATADNGALLRVRGLRRYFPVRRGVMRRQVGAIQAVDGVSFEIGSGETLGLVGESGSGKSTTGRLIVALDTPTDGQVLFRDEDIARLGTDGLRQMRQQVQVIFQDPYASLNPRMRIGRAIREPLDIHSIGTPRERDARVLELLDRVGLLPSHANRYPHEFSGGQRQRIGIARALATRPSFIVADEPISALDVSIQAQIVNLLAELKADLGLTYLFIAHDLSMVRHLSDRVAVMYLGRLVEIGPCDALFDAPLHPYTRALIAAIPTVTSAGIQQNAASSLQDEIPDPAAPPPGCRFHTRCPHATRICRSDPPALRHIDGTTDRHQVACHHAETLGRASTNREESES